MNEKVLSADILKCLQEPAREKIDAALHAEAAASRCKIVVLDDDPTGVQTVHDVSVYTDWSVDSIEQGFAEKNRLFFVLTNSRSFTREQTTLVHREIAENVAAAAARTGQEYMIVSRGDSTLRGHYPLETELLREGWRAASGRDMDGEILCPYFYEGGRFTLGNVHYVRSGSSLVPCGQTEFARDETFGYHASDLPEYIEEKTGGACPAESVICIPLERLRTADFDAVEQQLLEAHDYARVIVNAADDADVRAFAVALYRAMRRGRHFTIRCAAALVKALGDIDSRPLLTHAELLPLRSANGGIIVVGSHTQKTTRQLEELKKCEGVLFYEMNSDLVLQEGALEAETARLISQAGKAIAAGKTVCISTRRTLLTVPNDTPEQALLRSVKISNAVQRCVAELPVTPAFVIAKGGITSSDVGTKALRVRRALVLGQIEPGIPVWRTGPESRFPGVPYVIFPGNVGEADTLLHAAERLIGN